MLLYNRLFHIHRVKKILDMLAYFSLFSDIAVVIVNLLLLRSSTSSIRIMDLWLTISLMAEVAITLLLLLILVLLYHYDSLEWILLNKGRRGRPKKPRNRK
ncbi:MAG: hypothetical protein ACP5T3_01505 [Candidatus Micrarchaeia archaeon]